MQQTRQRKKKKYYKKLIENSVDFAWLSLYNDIDSENLLRNLKGMKPEDVVTYIEGEHGFGQWVVHYFSIN